MARPTNEDDAMRHLRDTLDQLEDAIAESTTALEEALLTCGHEVDGKRLSLAEDSLLAATSSIGSASGYVSIVERARARRAKAEPC